MRGDVIEFSIKIAIVVAYCGFLHAAYMWAVEDRSDD